MSDPLRFTDRIDAGRQLANALRDQGIDPDIVLAIPRGGLPLGRIVADAFGVPLDVAVASKIGAPNNPELALGAVASDGSVWRNSAAFHGTRADEEYFERQRRREAEAARQKAARYRGDRPEPDLAGKTVIVVDDGVATGATVRACLEGLRRTDAARIVVAIPVGPPETVAELRQLADDVVCLTVSRPFGAVGQFYEDFGQVADDTAMAFLDPSD